jgi:GNAT superfamily N-acetyltransferase
MNIKLSDIDSKRFGIRVAKLFVKVQDSIESAINWCELEKVAMVITRCATTDIGQVQKMENFGFYLTDTLVYYKNRHLMVADEVIPGGYSWRLASASDAELVECLAAKTFRDFFGHYHADPKLNKRDADLVYSSWAANSCVDCNLADVIFLISYGEKVIGFLTVKKTDSETCEIILNGIHPDHQLKGLYTSLVSLAKNWAIENEIKFMLVSTQITNIAPQKVWCRQGFEPFKSYYTFHKWFI